MTENEVLRAKVEELEKKLRARDTALRMLTKEPEKVLEALELYKRVHTPGEWWITQSGRMPARIEPEDIHIVTTTGTKPV